MLLRPTGCRGCVLDATATGFSRCDGAPELGVLLLGETLEDKEAAAGRPFTSPAGFRLEKMIERAGYKRGQFLIHNAVSCSPPQRRAVAPEAIEHCRRHWEPLAKDPRVKVVVPLGDAPLRATLGETDVKANRGYVSWSEDLSAFILPTVGPRFIMAGNSNWEAAFLYDLRHAVEIAAEGWTPVERDYTLDPTPLGALQWLGTFQRRLVADPTLALGTDIETPDKTTAEDEVDINLGYIAGPIYRIGFAYVWQGRTFTLSLPWNPSHMGTIDALLGCAAPKVFWYRHFDVPRIKAHGKRIGGAVHDGAEMWHVLHSDLPKKLEHVVPYVCPRQPRWKHLNWGETAAFYNATDAGVQVEGYYRLKALLEQSGMWGTYHADIFRLNQVLIYMSGQGMPIDHAKRVEASTTLMALKAAVQEKLNVTAADTRPTKIFKKFRPGLEEIVSEKTERYCTECNKPNVSRKHPHFDVGSAPGEVPLGELALRIVPAKAWVQPLDFKPSQSGLVRYAQFKGYKLLTRWDKDTQARKVVMDENAVRQYALKHPEDPIWPLVLEEREVTKLLGTYVGRVATDGEDHGRLTSEPEYGAVSHHLPARPLDAAAE